MFISSHDEKQMNTIIFLFNDMFVLQVFFKAYKMWINTNNAF